MKIIYLSGPITGIPNGNAEAFKEAEKRLTTESTIVVNPVTIGNQLKLRMQREPTWLEYMAADIPVLLFCHEIYMLRGWWKSRGARKELVIAVLFGIRVRFEWRVK